MNRPPNKESLRSRAYSSTRQQILDAVLAPGSTLSEYQLSAALNISRTPVREALRQLEREGLVVSIPQRGTFVAELNARDIREIYQVREQLEGFAARAAAEMMSDSASQALERELLGAAALTSDEKGPAFAADVHLHKAIIAVTQNKRLEQILNTLDDQVHIIRSLAPTSEGRLEQMTSEHLRIVRAIRERRPGEAEAAMREHLRAARDNAMIAALPVQV